MIYAQPSLAGSCQNGTGARESEGAGIRQGHAQCAGQYSVQGETAHSALRVEEFQAWCDMLGAGSIIVPTIKDALPC